MRGMVAVFCTIIATAKYCKEVGGALSRNVVNTLGTRPLVLR